MSNCIDRAANPWRFTCDEYDDRRHWRVLRNFFSEIVTEIGLLGIVCHFHHRSEVHKRQNSTHSPGDLFRGLRCYHSLEHSQRNAKKLVWLERQIIRIVKMFAVIQLEFDTLPVFTSIFRLRFKETWACQKRQGRLFIGFMDFLDCSRTSTMNESLNWIAKRNKHGIG